MTFPFHGKIPASFTCPRSSPKHERYVKTLALLMQARSFTASLTFDYVFIHNFKWVISSYHLVSRYFIPQLGLLKELFLFIWLFWVLIGKGFPFHCFSLCVFVVVLYLSPFKDSYACQVLNGLELCYITHNCKQFAVISLGPALIRMLWKGMVILFWILVFGLLMFPENCMWVTKQPLKWIYNLYMGSPSSLR